jgi:uncharacterized membrane protein
VPTSPATAPSHQFTNRPLDRHSNLVTWPTAASRSATPPPPDGVDRPTSGLRSGGPGSLVSWDSLGRQGRNFTGGGPTATELAAYTGKSATEPVRAYAGTLSAGDVEERATLAVQDLERAGGFDRANLLVATTTGSG